MRIGSNCSPCFFQNRYCQSALNRREVTQEDIKRVAGFEMLKEDADWNASPCKDWRTAQDVGVSDDLRKTHRVASRAGRRVEVYLWLPRRGALRPNVRAKRATTAGRQARAGENVPRTTGPGLGACRWRSA